MVITREMKEGAKYYHYCLDGKRISPSALSALCRRYLTDEGLIAMYRHFNDNSRCVIELDAVLDEDKLLEEKESELARERAKNAALVKKLEKAKIKAAKYDAIIARG